MNNVIFAFLITLLAGLSTGIGSCIAFFAKKTNTKFLSISLGFSAGVMIYVSMIEIFPKAQDALTKSMGEKLGSWSTVIAFFIGMAIIAVIDKLIPQEENPHEIKKMENIEEKNIKKNKSLLRTGIFTAMAIAIHNFPEGLATFISALDDVTIAIPIAIAIAIHNIPEGISVSVPVYYATGDKKKAFYYSFLSGMSEPLGAIIGYALLRNFFNDITLGIVFAIVGGIMVFISLDELLPSAREYGEHHLSIYGLIAGMGVMAISLLLFK
ncbi:zinc transporter ZupT [Clostridioides difficile]|uniref:zinc transporter ZupT n=1 Tax=Clostridioides difficile TaxID=1496 RepID=UPI0024120FD8|nr:zinc transporter ZupT [Clostridioides difficile]